MLSEDKQRIMIAPTHIASLEGGPRHHVHPSEVIQQPRRFACDRCRMQKLRCERDIWRPSLMPCKRCRKARMTCTISSMDRPISKKKSKDRPLTVTRPEKTAVGKRQFQGVNGKPPGLDVSDQSPVDAPAGLYSEAMPEGFNVMGVSKFVPEIMQPDDCYPANCGFEEYSAPIFSGLITPPSMEGEREHQVSLETASFMVPQQNNWTPMSESKKPESFECDDPFPCLDDREQWWDQENLRRLLDINIHLLGCQGLVTQELAMLGNMDANVALTNLESASQNVLCYSQQFLDVVKVFVHGDFTSIATTPIPGSMAVNVFIPQLPTPSQSRRPSHVPQTTVPTVEPGMTQGCNTSIPQISPVATHASAVSSQASWRGSQFEDVQVSLILATINCYTCLVGSYHIILSYLLHELMAVATPEQPPQSSPTFPGFAAAFAATSQVPQPDRDSQLRMIFHNCMQMLAQLEMSLGMPEQHCVASWALLFSAGHFHHRRDGILSSPVAAVLLDTLVGQRFGLCVNGLATGKNSMRDIIAAINQLFDPVHSVSQVTVSTV